MKSTGIVRRIDRLGRVVLPMELRKTLGRTVCPNCIRELKKL